MKFHYIIILFISSCFNQGKDAKNQQIPIADSISNIKIKTEINFIDEKGLKQGLWKINDSLNNEIREVFYKDNELDSISKIFHFSQKNKLVSLALFKNGKIQWSVIPEYFNNTHPYYTKAFALKGIIIYEDSVYVKVPYENGNIWFEGTYIRLNNYNTGLPSGVLKSYFKNGKINTIENWKLYKKPYYNNKVGGGSLLNGKFQMFDSIGNKKLDTNFNMAPMIL